MKVLQLTSMPKKNATFLVSRIEACVDAVLLSYSDLLVRRNVRSTKLQAVELRMTQLRVPGQTHDYTIQAGGSVGKNNFVGSLRHFKTLCSGCYFLQHVDC